jgi:hypothetical protein
VLCYGVQWLENELISVPVPATLQTLGLPEICGYHSDADVQGPADIPDDLVTQL